ncbi:MAG: TonB-dependent receptor [Gammaproteobacteria bacterium]|nr:TonB-dependent receptor [Gammaproteobacteria bacterium]
MKILRILSAGPLFIGTIAMAMSVAVPSVAGAADDEMQMEEVVTTGSRIRKSAIDENAPVLSITGEDLDKSGLTSVADFLQRLSVSGSPLNTRFNSSGNFGFPPDGGGVGAGAAQVDLRHLGSKRVLVLVDGVRWVPGASGSGVPGAVDLNTIPVSIIDRIEVLEDGASSIYGSDAIAGVVNVITKKDFDGFEASAYYGSFSEGDGETQEYTIASGMSSERASVFFNLSYTDQERVSAADREQARFPVPGTGVAFGSSGTPQGRFFVTDPNTSTQLNCTTLPTFNGTPSYNPADPCGLTDDFIPWAEGANGTRFNFSPFNLVVTPSKRTSVYGQSQFEVSDNVTMYLKGLYTNRKSTNQAAPEPIFIGPEAGNGNILDTISIPADHPFNPFGFDIDADTNAYFMGRRPLESGPRIFKQDVNTYYVGGGFNGEFEAADRTFYWDVNASYSRNRADQRKFGAHNARKIKDALGPAFETSPGSGVFQCGTPSNPIDGCVPLNYFGGQGTDGSGSITPEMLAWIGFIQHDVSENELTSYSGNITGDIVELPAGPLAFAAGFESRSQDGFFEPDSVVSSGDTAGIPAKPTSGGFDVDEFYVEFDIPLVMDKTGIKELGMSAAIRTSDYSTFGSESAGKFGLRWRPTDDLLIRGTFGEGFRAPNIGELFGSQTRFDATLADPCSDFNNTGVSQQIIDNCVLQGVPADGSYVQFNPQISVITGGNVNLNPETADSITLGGVYNPSWVDDVDWLDGLEVAITYFSHELDGAIQAVDAQTQLDACALTNDPAFCSAIGRTGSGVINSFQNTLTNIGGIETDGYDVNLTAMLPENKLGQFSVAWYNTFLSEFTEILADPTQPSGFRQRSLEGLEENDSAWPEWKSTLIVDWLRGDFGGSWTTRLVDGVTEDCSGQVGFGVCSDEANGLNSLGTTVYHDVQVRWTPAMLDEKWEFSVGANNLFDRDPPLCFSCSLNGYDAATYDIPGGRFWYLQAVTRR